VSTTFTTFGLPSMNSRMPDDAGLHRDDQGGNCIYLPTATRITVSTMIVTR
jgi:hypothetical protein